MQARRINLPPVSNPTSSIFSQESDHTQVARPLPSIPRQETRTSMSPLSEANKKSMGTQTTYEVKFNTQPYEFTENDLMCPINHTFMDDPVLATDGYTYERTAIERWAKEIVNRAKEVVGKQIYIEELRANIAINSPMLRDSHYLLLEMDNPYTPVPDARIRDIKPDLLDKLLKPLLTPNVLCKKITQGWISDKWELTACKELNENRGERVEKILQSMRDQNITLDGDDEDFYKYINNFRKNQTRKRNNLGLGIGKIRDTLSKVRKMRPKRNSVTVAPLGGSKKRKSIKERKQMRRGGGKTKKI